MALTRIAGLDAQFQQDETGNLYENGVQVAPRGKWDMDEGNNLTVNGEGYGPQARADALREQGYLPVESIGRLDPSQFNWPALVQQLGLTPVTGPSGEQMLSAADRTKVNEWGTQQGILQDSGGFGDFLQEAAIKIGPIVAAIAGVPGLTPGLGDIVSGAAGAAGAGAGGATGAFDAFGALNSPTGLGAAGTVFDAAAAGGAGLGSALLNPSLITSPVAPVSTGSVFGTADPFLQGVTQTMPATLGSSTVAGSTLGTAAPFTAGLGAATGAAAIPGLSEAIQQAATQAGGAAGSGLASAIGGAAPAAGAAAGSGAGLGLGSAATTAALASGLGSASTQAAPTGSTMPTLDGEGGLTPTTYTDAGGTMSQLEAWARGLGMPEGLLGSLLTPQNIGAIGSSLLGVLGSRDQANAYRDTANQFLNMGAPYRDRLASLYANPESYTTGPEMQGVMKAFNQSLSSQYGNPFMSPTATAQSVAYGLGALGKEKDRLAGYGGLGFNPASMAGLSAQGNSNSGTYNALGSGLAQLTQPQDNTGSMLQDLLRAQTARLNSGMGL